MNKLENVNFDWERYNFIKSLVEDHLNRIGFKKQDVFFVPISGLKGENVFSKAQDERLVKWYGAD